MKRKFLPLSLTLITIVLGVLILGFSTNQSNAKYTPRLSDEASLVYGIKPSVEYLAGIRNNQTTGVIAPEDLDKVQNQLKKFESTRSTENLSWRQLGPDSFGGRTRAIMFDNQDAGASTVYAAGVTGGIWKSNNVGTTWQKVNSSTYNLFVTCMKQDANGTIYAGTGESFAAETLSGISSFGLDGFMGNGIYKSTDGDNFTPILSTQPNFNDNNSDWAFINEIAVNMDNGNLYAATNSGLMFSADGGDSWSIAKDTSGAELNMNTMDVQVSSDGSLVACIDNKCFISVSGDENAFVNRSTGDSISLPDNNYVSRIEFAFAPSDANVLYASVVDGQGSLNGIFLSEDKGETWRVILPGSPAMSIFMGQGVYDNAITVFPENPYRVLLGGVNAWEGIKLQETGLYSWNSISSSFGSGFSSSYLHADHHTYVFRPGTTNSFMIGTDGGVAIGVAESDGFTFQQSNRSYFTTQFYSIGTSGSLNYVTGGSQDNGTILVSGDGNTSKQGEEILRGDGVGTVVSVINKDVLVVSEPGNEFDFIFRSEDGGVNYSNQFMGPLSLSVNFFYTPMALWESFDNANSRDSVMYYAKETKPAGTSVQVISTNSNQPFYYTVQETLNEGDSIMVQDIVSSRYFVASFNKVYMTKELHDFGKMPEWFEISNNSVGFTGAPQCIGYSNDANHIFVGTRDGRLYRISNLALAYNYERADVNSSQCIVSTQEIPLTIPGTSDPITQVVTSVAVDPGNPQNVLITLGNYGNDAYVLYSENALDQTPVFESRQGNLPDMPVYSSVIEMTDTDMGIIGTEHGIFVTENIHDESTEWTQQDSLMGAVPVFQLTQQRVSKTVDTVTLVNGEEVIKIIYPGTNNYGVIYAATFGRGLLRCNGFQKPVGIEDNVLNDEYETMSMVVYPNPVGSNTTFDFEANSSNMAEISVFDLSGRKVMFLKRKVLKGNNEIGLNLSELKAGSYVIQMTIGTDIYTHKIIAN